MKGYGMKGLMHAFNFVIMLAAIVAPPFVFSQYAPALSPLWAFAAGVAWLPAHLTLCYGALCVAAAVERAYNATWNRRRLVGKTLN